MLKWSLLNKDNFCRFLLIFWFIDDLIQLIIYALFKRLLIMVLINDYHQFDASCVSYIWWWWWWWRRYSSIHIKQLNRVLHHIWANIVLTKKNTLFNREKILSWHVYIYIYILNKRLPRVLNIVIIFLILRILLTLLNMILHLF